MIKISKPSIPNKKVFYKYIDRIFKTRILTNNGPIIKEFESALEKKYKIKNIVLTNSATNALMICLKVFNIQKNVLTTPFTYRATANAAKFLNLNILFADINSNTLNLNPSNIKSTILKNLEAIIPVHSFGIPSEIKKFDKFRKKGIKIIYDAAHCFGIKYNNKSILNYGDASVVSLHATKVFNTCEGGLIVFKKKRDANKARKLINIGLLDEVNNNVGINCKLTEIQAAWGLSLLRKFPSDLKKRQKIFNMYKQKINTNVIKPTANLKENNYSYFPIIFKSEKLLLNTIKNLKIKKIESRRYFYPSLNLTKQYISKNSNPVSESLAKRIICLPMSSDYSEKEIDKVIKIINTYSV